MFYTSTYGANAVLATLLLLLGYGFWAMSREDGVPTWSAWGCLGAAVYCGAVAVLTKQFREPYIIVEAGQIRVNDRHGKHVAAWANVSAVREARNGLEIELRSGATVRIGYFDMLHGDIRRLVALVRQLAPARDDRQG